MTTPVAKLSSLAELQSLLPNNSTGQPRWPQLRAAEFQSQAVTLRLWVPADLYWFAGHFSGRPVLAGVVQTHWAATLSAAIFEPTGAFAGIDGLKFHQLVLPATELTLQLSVAADSSSAPIDFVFTRQSQATLTKISEGRLRYQ